MRVSRAKRRWMTWCRYTAATGSSANPDRKWGYLDHDGLVFAYNDVMHARRYYPIGARAPWYPRWIEKTRPHG